MFTPISRINMPSAEEFQADYVRPLVPVVLSNLASAWPASEKWTPAYFIENFGHYKVPVYDASFAQPGGSYMSNIDTMRFDTYLRCVLEEDRDLRMFLYNIVRQIPGLLDDLVFPDLIGGFSTRFVFMFFGCRGAQTPIHYDIDMGHVLHTTFHGKKRFILFPFEQAVSLYRQPFTVRSYVDVLSPDFNRYPALARTQGFDVTLNPGETIFIPSGYWHLTIYEEPGYGISLRAPCDDWTRRLQGFLNLLVLSPCDRLMNKLMSRHWFNWKSSFADARAHRWLEKNRKISQ